MKRFWSVGAAAFLAFAVKTAAVEVTGTRRATADKVGVTILAGQLELPAAGHWSAREPDPGSCPLNQLCLIPERTVDVAPQDGRRMQEVKRQQTLQRGMYPLNQLRWACADYARSHNGVGPATLAELQGGGQAGAQGPRPQAAPWNAMLDSLQRCPWDGEPRRPPPYYFLIPSVPMTGTAGLPPAGPGALVALPANPVVPQALELQPYQADGKHWVLFSDGQTRRVPIDAELLKKHGLAVTPVLPSVAAAPAVPPNATARYRLCGLLRDPAATRAELVLVDWSTGQNLACTWALTPAVAVTGRDADDVLLGWVRPRQLRWAWGAQAGSTVLRAWTAVSDAVAVAMASSGTTSESTAEAMRQAAERQARQQARPGSAAQTTSAFHVFGGQAAIRETLQLEAIRMAQGAPAAATPAATPIPIAQIQGVTVRAHPFQDMLAGREGGRLPLADVVPADRFLVYWAKPAALPAYLGDGSDFLARIGSLASGSCANYNLKQRYLARLGMDEAWLQAVLKANLVTEMALVLPDLFLIEGTDVTVVARVPSLVLFQPVLTKLGVAGLKEGTVTERALATGGKAYWSCAGDLLLVSTCRGELDAVLARRANQGRDSLGQSAEFRYMLTQLPLAAGTRAYVYFSDPFIRRLVGPATKIGQLRRLNAAARLELATAAALLYQLDGHPETPTLERLVNHGYLPAAYGDGDISLQPDLRAASAAYGTLDCLATLASQPVESATAAEAEAYKSYVDSYSRYWRQFFDPIALRLDDTGDGSLELTTFILPLLDSSLYRNLREVLASRETGAPLPVPTVQPPAVVACSLNLADESWTRFSAGLGELLVRYAGLDPRLLDLLGPGVHLFIRDSDPIVALGSGDLLGAFGGDALLSFGGGGRGMVLLPVALSVLTRPCVLCVELSDPDAARSMFRRGVSPRPPTGRGLGEAQVSLTQYPGRDAWLLGIGFGNVVNLRFGLEIAGKYLVISNVPWSQQVQLTAPAPAPLNGAVLAVNPAAIQAQLPALFTAAAEQQRHAAMQGIGCLYPLMAGTPRTPEAAAALHARLFGFTPVHPGNGRWVWREGRLESDTFGRPNLAVQPPYQPGNRQFGLLRDVDSISVCMQLEESGLRTLCRWKRPPAGR